LVGRSVNDLIGNRHSLYLCPLLFGERFHRGAHDLVDAQVSVGFGWKGSQNRGVNEGRLQPGSLSTTIIGNTGLGAPNGKSAGNLLIGFVLRRGEDTIIGAV
jgi:hypothetical protein